MGHTEAVPFLLLRQTSKGCDLNSSLCPAHLRHSGKWKQHKGVPTSFSEEFKLSLGHLAKAVLNQMVLGLSFIFEFPRSFQNS